MSMIFFKKIKDEVLRIWDIESNRVIIKDFSLFFVATIVFHFLYWNTNMNTWIFGPFTDNIFDFFTRLAYKGTVFFVSLTSGQSFDVGGLSLYFYNLSSEGLKEYYGTVTVIEDCSAVKQLLQWALIMILCRGNRYKKIVYYLLGGIVILIANILRITTLTDIYAINTSLFQPLHDWVFRPFMYVIIFAMWLFWLHLINKKKEKSKA